ncbi:DUF4214 domain-containing protein [Bradyrhizobium sp. MOS002]|uniref:DUF4214 domain-containing protein n=1 Tax=Bradyrhizobium sp. MOS002 TaxID=2133947 RepID=UPI000D4470C7|nr:DUF4214 domain-containing protein [Bradyrhizobium sp. MOS002]PSO26030.1 hypothetical protein C7G41_29090 [Bradyrhizobium sp. MOS002]
MTVSSSLIASDYQHILFRGASASELSAWSALETNSEVIAGIEHSPEALLYVDPVIRLYQGAFNRTPDVAGLGANVDTMRDGHHSIYEMANAFVHSAEFTNTYGALSDAQYVEQLYHNVLNRVGTQAEVDSWLATGLDRGHILVGFTESAEFISNSANGLQNYLDQIAAGQQPAGGHLAGSGVSPFTFSPDAPLDSLGQSQSHPGTMITGSGIPALHGSSAVDSVTGTQLWLSASYRTSDTMFEQTSVGVDGTVHFQGLAGTQDGSFNEQGSNANRGHLALNFAAVSGVNGLQNNEIKLFLDTDPSNGTHYKELDLHIINGVQVWTDTSGNPVIGDDPQVAPNSIAENTANMMFGYWLGNSAPPAAGHYDVMLTEKSVVGTMTNHIVIDLV